jgi:hypothetical protein
MVCRSRRISKWWADVRVTHTVYINRNSSKNAHENKLLVVSTNHGEDKRPDSKEDTEDG